MGTRPLRTFLLLSALVAVAASSWWFWRNRSGKDDEPKYRTEKVDRGTVQETVSATGAISAVITVQVGSQVSGIVSRLLVDFNSPVRKGQLLAELDPTPFQASVDQRRADLSRAEVQMRQAEIEFRRSERLLAEGLTPQADYDAAKAGFEAAKAQVEQARAAARQAEANLSYTKIYSPIDGVVVDRQYDVGQTVAASFQAPTLFTIAQDLTKMQVQADVDQADIGRVSVGQKARFTVDAYPGEEFEAEISQIRLNATANQNVITYPVILTVDNPGERLRPQMTANVTIVVSRWEDALRVPNAALRFRPGERDAEASAGPPSMQRAAADLARGDGKGTGKGPAEGMKALEAVSTPAAPPLPQAVYVLGVDGEPKRTPIRAGATDGRYTVVAAGELKPGDTVITGLATAKSEFTGSFPGGGGPGRRF
jgi:HlyD family secretion protein